MALNDDMLRIINGEANTDSELNKAGYEAKLLRNNEYINQAIARMKLNYIIKEDASSVNLELTPDERAACREYYSTLRILTDAFLDDLDQAIFELEQQAPEQL